VATQMHDLVTGYFQYPDIKGQFGALFVAETLMGPLKDMRMMMDANNRSVE
jgi:hypothetical protein